MSEFKGSKNWRCGNDEYDNNIHASGGYEFIYSGSGYYSDKTNRGFGISAFMCKEDKNLIIAAPDLLEALIAVVRVADRVTDEFDMARAAIAKALGETK